MKPGKGRKTGGRGNSQKVNKIVKLICINLKIFFFVNNQNSYLKTFEIELKMAMQ